MANYCVYSGGNGTSGAVAGSVPTAGEWATAYQSISAALTAITEAEGDIIFVANDHVNNSGATITLTPAFFIKVISIDRANTTTATPLAGAQENTNGNFALAVNSTSYWYGITFSAGAGASSSGAFVTASSSTTVVGNSVFDTCTFYVNSTNVSPNVAVGASDNGINHLTKLKNCVFKFKSTSQKIRLIGAIRTIFENCSIDATGSTPAAIFVGVGRGGQTVFISASDFSLGTALYDVSSLDDPSSLFLVDCLVPSTITTGTHAGIGSNVIELHACGTTTDDHAYQYYLEDGTGIVQHDTGVFLTTGSATFTDVDGTSDPLSLKMVSNANANIMFPLYTPWLSVEVLSTGSKTFSIKVGHTLAAVLKDNECWIELEYLGTAANALYSKVVSAPVVSGSQSIDVLAAGSNMTDTAVAWTGIASEKTHTLSKTVTINQQGFARARIGLAKASSTIYVDPVVTVA